MMDEAIQPLGIARRQLPHREAKIRRDASLFRIIKIMAIRRASVASKNTTLARTSHGGNGVKKSAEPAMTRTVKLSRTRSTMMVPNAELILRPLFFVMR